MTPDGSVLLEIDPVAAEVRALEVHVDRAARAGVVLLRTRTAGKRADRSLHDLDALHEERIHEKAGSAADRDDAVKRGLGAAHAADLESARLPDEKRLAAGLHARNVAEKVVEVGRVVLADEVLGQRVDDCRRLFGREVGEGRAVDRLWTVLGERRALDYDRSEIGYGIGCGIRVYLIGPARHRERGGRARGKTSAFHTPFNAARTASVHGP